MKRYAIPALAGVLVFGVVTGFAATLDVTTTTLGSGDEAVASCNATAGVTYTTAFDATLGGYEVATAPVVTSASCAGMSYKVTLTGAGGASLAETTGTLAPVPAVGAVNPPAAGSAEPAFTNILAENVTGVSVVITG